MVERKHSVLVQRPSGDLFNVQTVKVTESFWAGSRVPSPRVRFCMWFKWLRQNEDIWRQKKTQWVLRHERGEVGDRPHFHFLIRGLPRSMTGRHYRLAAMERWEALGGGMARIRRFDETQAGVAYTLKNLGANAYEMSKFALNDPEAVTLSPALLEALAKRQASVSV